ncbi:MAG: glycosyltransferase family 9 protein [Elusimicrobia bacterium]|nr:glycosyltransferase family 9 protein [Elusimicrobiota bacterium]
MLVWFKKPSPELSKRVADRYLDSLHSLGVPLSNQRPALSFPENERLSEDWEKRLGNGPIIGLAPGALHETKRWLPERFAEAADELSSKMAANGKPARILIFGAAADMPAVKQVLAFLHGPAMCLAGQTSVRELCLLIRRCSVLLTNDSGAMHVASALKVPTVAIFGPTVEGFGFFPEKDCAEVVQRLELSCRPCSLHGSARCPEGHFRCMRDISVSEVMEAARRALRS